MNFEKRNNIYRIIMLVVITALITFLVTAIGVAHYYENTSQGIEKQLVNNKNLNFEARLQYIREYLEKNYWGEFPEDSVLEESAIKGYVEGLGDPYTQYLTKTEYADLLVDVQGNYVGIGIYMAQDVNGNVVVLSVIENTPAEEIGIKAGDILYKVNGEECKGMDLSLVASKVKGEENTTVEIEIKRDGETITKTIERKTIVIKQVESDLLEGNIGYINISGFEGNVKNEFETKYNELLQKNIKALIIDVRNNGGGLVTDAIGIAELFVGKDKNIMIEVSKDNKEEIIKSSADPKKANMKVVVLTNENSASASEILVGALKENKVATIVGTKTFGKGVMQEIIPLATGGALKVTFKEFRTPNGNVINKEGIEPDVKIEDDEKTEKDEQLQKAIEECKK